MVYIELLFLEDFIYNYIIIFSVSILLKRITNIKRILLSSIIGTISLIAIIIPILKSINIITSIFISLIMSIISFSYKNIIYTIKNIFYMYISSIFIAGTIYLINTTIIINIDNNILSIIILIILSPFITIIYLASIKRITTNYSNYYKLDIYIEENNMISTMGFLDTGNKLIDPYKKRPIILLNQNLIKNIPQKIILVPCKTINNETLLKCIIPKKIFIQNIEYNKKILIGLVEEINIEGAECILHQKLLERI